MTVADVHQLGFKVVLHWTNVPAVSERDAFSIMKRQTLISEKTADHWYSIVTQQQPWPWLRTEAHQRAYQEAMRGRKGTPEDRDRAQRAMLNGPSCAAT